MRAKPDQLPVAIAAGEASIRATDWGEMRAVVLSLPAGTDMTPLLQGLPDDLCPCPHWGYVLQGRLRVRYADGEETLRAGDLYYMPPGHTGLAEEDTQFVEFVNPEQQQPVAEAIRRNLAAMR